MHRHSFRALRAVALLAAFASGCATGGGRAARQERPPVVVAADVGMASWYGREHHGRRTASGERFDMNALTAAHRTLPFGTRVRVTNLDNGRAVEVHINDRGPFRRGRILDVSKAAAAELRMIGPGTARVRIEVVGDVASGD